MGEEQVFPMIFFIGVQPHTPLERRLLKDGYLKPGYNPMSLNPVSIKRMLYNPRPLNGPISEACLTAWKDGTEDAGRKVLLELERVLLRRRGRRRGVAAAAARRPGGAPSA